MPEDNTQMMFDPEKMKGLMGITAKDEAAIKAIGKQAIGAVPEFIDDFYKHISTYPEFDEFIKSEEIVERLKAKQVLHWEEFFSGKVTTTYLENRYRVGRIHAEIKLPVYTYISSLNFSQQWWLNFFRKSKIEKSKLAFTEAALAKFINLDICVIGTAFSTEINFVHDVTLNNIVRRIEQLALGNYDVNFDEEEGDIKGLFEALRAVAETHKEVVSLCQALAVGDFSKKLESRGDRDKLTAAVNQMVDNFKAVVDQANQISRGHYDMQFKPHNEKDELGIALVNMTTTLSNIAEIAEKVSHGDYTARAEVKSEDDGLALGVNAMTESIEKTIGENEQGQWLKTGQAGLSDAARGVLDINQLGNKLITYLAKYLGANVGAFYHADDEGNLNLSATYAYTKRKKLINKVKPGEGIVGQVLIEKEPILLENLPEDYINVSSGLGEMAPRNIIVVPAISAGEVRGVIELASIKPLTDREVSFLRLVSENIAILIQVSQEREATQKLLNKTQSQAEELESQQEELRATNDELKVKSDSLEVQQEELSQSNAELEEQRAALEEQSVKLLESNSELEVSKKEIDKKAQALEISGKYKSDFLANMSHELRTPLNSIIVLAQMLAQNKKHNLNEKQIDSAKTIHESGNDLLRLINDILDLSKVESGQLEIEHQIVEVKDIAAVMERTFRVLMDEKDLSFEIHFSPNCPKAIVTDKMRVEQVVKNFLSNALKFTAKGSIMLVFERPAGDVDLSISCLDKNNSIAISVKDEGIGIPEDKQDMVFEAFKQEDSSISRRFAGTGLGLSVARDLASLLGGEVKLVSKKDVGSTFTLYLPEKFDGAGTQLKDQKSTEVKEAKEVKEKAEDSTPLVGSILLIEDDAGIRKAVSCLMEENNINTEQAANLDDGLRMLQYKKVDCIILDLMLNGQSGFTLIDLIKKEDKDTYPPVIVYTGKDLTKAEREQLEEFASSIILKDEKSPERLLHEVGLYIAKAKDKSPVENAGYPESNGNRDEIFEGKTLLLVDDDMRNIFSLKQVLDEVGFNVIVARTGIEALDKLTETEKVNVVLMDIMMPEMDGFEAIARIRKQAKFHDLPIIALTAKAMKGDREKCLEVGASDYMPKPVDVNQLLSLLRIWLSK